MKIDKIHIWIVLAVHHFPLTGLNDEANYTSATEATLDGLPTNAVTKPTIRVRPRRPAMAYRRMLSC
jgi:hypothetical protein